MVKIPKILLEIIADSAIRMFCSFSRQDLKKCGSLAAADDLPFLFSQEKTGAVFYFFVNFDSGAMDFLSPEISVQLFVQNLILNNAKILYCS